MTIAPTSRLPARVVLFYSLPAFGLSALSLVFYTYVLKFYSDIVGIGLGFLGGLVLAVRTWDALIDPFIGSLSDRTITPLGRRRPWIAAGAIPLGLVFWFLLTPGPLDEWSPWRLAIGAFAFFLFWTVVTIPYEALGAELSPDYDDRNRLLGAREAAGIAGMVAGAVLPAVLEALGWAGRSAGDVKNRFAVMGLVLGGAAAASCLLCVLLVKERTLNRQQRPVEACWPDLRVLLRNRPFRLLVIAFTLVQVGIGISTTLYTFFNEEVLGNRRGDLFLGAYLVVGLLSVPAWIQVARRTQKRLAWQIALGICTAAFTFVLLLGRGDAYPFLFLILISALGLGGILAIPPSMQADAIDLDELQSGKRREGQFLGLWYIARKGAQAVGAAAAFPILGAAGYDAGASAQPPLALSVLTVLYAGVPCACYALAILAIRGYDLDRATHQRVREKLSRTALAAAP